MPLTRIICPHCETTVEISTTSVTRSRDCPHCGRTILLQFTTQEKRQRRKALLTSTASGEGKVLEGAEPGLAVTPRPIEGDLRERMMLDPEVRQRVRIIKISVAVITLVTAVVVLGSVFHWWTGIAQYVGDGVKQFNASRVSSTDDPAADAKAGRKSTDSGVKMTFPTPPVPVPVAPPKEVAPVQDEAAISKVVVSFLQAANVDQRLGLVLGQKTAETRMREYYKHHPDGAIPYETIESLGPDSTDKAVFSYLVVMKDGERRRLVLRQSKAKGYLVDWPSFVIYSDMEWGEFVDRRPKDPVLFRVVAGQADVYRNEFLDPNKFVCLQVNNPLDMHAPPLYAYAQRSSSLGHSLEFVMRRAAGTSVPLILKLKFPDAGASPDQVWVDEFVGEGWVTRIW